MTYFVFDALRSMGTCIKLLTTISPNFFRSAEKVEELRSFGFSAGQFENATAFRGKEKPPFEVQSTLHDFDDKVPENTGPTFFASVDIFGPKNRKPKFKFQRKKICVGFFDADASYLWTNVDHHFILFASSRMALLV